MPIEAMLTKIKESSPELAKMGTSKMGKKEPAMTEVSTDVETAIDWLTVAEAARFRATAFAQLLGVSLRRLEQEFEATVHSTPKHWLEEARLWKAARLLTQGMQPKMLAAELHYEQESNFCRRFKRYHGCTPKQFVQIFQDLRARERHAWGPEGPFWKTPDEIDSALLALNSHLNRLARLRMKAMQLRIKTMKSA